MQGAIARFHVNVPMAAIGTCKRKARSQSYALSNPVEPPVRIEPKTALNSKTSIIMKLTYRAKWVVRIETKIEMNLRQVPFIHQISVNIQVRALFI